MLPSRHGNRTPAGRARPERHRRGTQTQALSEGPDPRSGDGGLHRPRRHDHIHVLCEPRLSLQGNIFNNLRNATTIAIMAIGVTMVIISGGIDLSVGSVLAVSAMVMARLFYHGAGTIAGLAAGLAFGVFLGVVNSQMVTRIKLPPFIATLGMLSIGRGLTVLFATGLRGSVASNISIDRTLIEFLGGGYIGPVPMPVIIAAVLFAFFGWFLKHTVLGRQVYAVGSNEEAARLSGVNVDRVKLFTYSVTGFLAALAGILQAGLLSTAVTKRRERAGARRYRGGRHRWREPHRRTRKRLGRPYRGDDHDGSAQLVRSAPSPRIRADDLNWCSDNPGSRSGRQE
jgi:ABC-type uncharacterized transport system permease subunit